MSNLMQKIVKPVHGQSGGNKFEAGAFIDVDKEESLIESAKAVLAQQSLEETI